MPHLIAFEKIPVLLRQKVIYFLLFIPLLASLSMIVWVTGDLTLCPVLRHQEKCTFILLDLIPILVALGYWVVSAANHLSRQKLPGILFFMTGATTIAGGLLSGTGNNLGVFLFYINFAFLSPLTLHFHTTLLKRPLRLLEKFCVGTLYLLATAEVLPFLIGGISFVQQNIAYPILRYGIRLTFPVAILLTIGILAYDYNHFSTLASRRQIRLYAHGIAFAFTPLVFSTLLPQTLGFHYVAPGINFSWLLLIPLLYTFSVHRHRWGFTEKAFRSFLAYYLLFFILLSVYLFATNIFQRVPPLSGPGIVGLSIFVLLCLFLPIRKRLFRLVNWAFYGSETDYSIAIDFLDQELVKVLDRKSLVTILLDELVSALKPTYAVLFLRDPYTNGLTYAGVRGWPEDHLSAIQLSPGSSLCALLTNYAKPVETAKLMERMGDRLTPAETQLLQLPHVELWLPILSEDQLVGVMLISYREGDDLFTEEDKRLLAVVLHGAGVAVRNVMMAENLQAGSEELSKAHRRLIAGQEQERKRIARELHDEVIQQLLGISYMLASLKKKVPVSAEQFHKQEENKGEAILFDLQMAQADILMVVTYLREVIRELRPAGLDELGLPAAIMGYIEQIQKTNGPDIPKILFDVRDFTGDISEAASICVFRVAQESIRNAIKHSRASTLTIHLSGTCNDRLLLDIQDNGCGFSLPDRLTELTRENHFGLVGITERVMIVGGEVTIQSRPGQGTRITVNIPLN